MLQEFKDFISKGNVVDLAVAVVIGAAFAPVVGTFVSRILMPLVGMVIGQPNFDTLGTFACEAVPVVDGVAAPTAGLIINGAGLECTGSVGAVLTIFVNFVLVALAVFLAVKAYNKTKAPEPEAAPAGPPADEVLLSEIRDLLATQTEAMS